MVLCRRYRTATCLKLFLKFPSLLFLPLAFEFHSPLLILRWSWSVILAERVENMARLEPFFKFSSRPLLAFEFSPLLFPIMQSGGRCARR